MLKTETSREEIVQNIKNIDLMLQNPDLLTEKDRTFIQEFLESGLYYFGIEFYSQDPEMAEHMMNTCRALEEDETGLVNPSRVSSVKNRLITKIQKLLKQGESLTDEDYLALAEVYAKNLFLVDPSALDYLMEIMSPEEYRKSPIFNYLMPSFDEVEKRHMSPKFYEELLYKYVDLHILNEEEFDFNNDEFAKRFTLIHIQNVKEEYKIKKELYNLMQVSPDKLSKQDLLKIANGMVNILQYSSYSVLDKQLLEDFVSQGFFTNEKLVLDVNGANYLEKIVSLLMTNDQVKSNIKADSRLSEKYDLYKFFGLYKGALKQNLLQNGDKISDIDYIELAKIYANGVQAPSLAVIGKARDKMTPYEFWNSELYLYAQKRFQDKVRSGEVEKEYSSSEYLTFAFEYIEYLKRNNAEINYEEDSILANMEQIHPGSLRVQEILMANGRIKPTDQDIYQINQYIASLLKSSYNDAYSTLSECEKKYIETYMKRYLSYSIRDIENHQEVVPIIRYLSKIRANTTLSGKTEDKNFFNKVIPDDFSRIIACRINMGSDNTHMTNDELEEILYLVAADNIYDTDVFLQGMANLSDRQVPIERSIAMKRYIESFANQYTVIEPVSITEDEKPVFNIVYDYVDMITRDPASFNIYEEQGISDILQLVNKKKLPKEQSDMIYGIIENNLKVSRYNTVRDKQLANKFVDRYKDKPCKSEEEFDRFLEYLQHIKLAERRPFPLKYCKTVIKQVLLDGSVIRNNPEKYTAAVERMIEDLSNGLGMRFQDTTYFIRSELNGTESLGEERDRDIRLKKIAVDRLVRDKDVSCLETLFHENTHQEQDYDSRRGKYGQYIRYITEKESIIRSYNEKYYVDNYQYMFCEIEAREQGNSKLIDFLRDLDIDLESSFVFHTLITRDIEKILSERAEREKENYKQGEEKLISDAGFSGRERVTTYFDALVKKNPIIIRQHPILAIEYNPDGSLKDFTNFISDMERHQNETDMLILYREIIGKGNIIRPETIADTLNMLMTYRSPNMKVAANMRGIISDNIARVLDDTASTLDKFPLTELYKLKGTLEMVSSDEELDKNPLLKGALNRPGIDSDKTGYDAILETKDLVDIIIAHRRNKPIDLNKYPRTVRQFAFNLTGGKGINSELRVFKEASMETPSEDKLKAMEELIQRQEENDSHKEKGHIEKQSQELGEESNEK